MITNESLFDHFTGQRRRGVRNPWHEVPWQSVNVPMAQLDSVPIRVVSAVIRLGDPPSVGCGQCPEL